MEASNLIYDQGLEKGEQESFFEMLDPSPKEKIPLVQFSWDKFFKKDLLQFWVVDEQAEGLLTKAPRSLPKIVFPPYFGFKEIDPSALLMANEVLCFNSLVIGDRLGILFDSVEIGLFNNFKTRYKRVLELFRKGKLQSYQFTNKDGEEVKSM